MAETTRFTFTLTDEQHKKLLALAELERRSAADTLRVLIEDVYKERVEVKK